MIVASPRLASPRLASPGWLGPFATYRQRGSPQASAPPWLDRLRGAVPVIPAILPVIGHIPEPRVDWNLQLLRFVNRVGVYLALMDDRYSSTEEEQAVHLDFAYPDARQNLNRWLPLVKWFLAIPHYLALVLLYLGAIVVVIGAWFAIL